MMIVAYYTRDTPYERDAELLRASLDRLELDHTIVGVPDRGSWDANTARKATMLRNWRNLLRGLLLYVDVDAFVHADPWPHVDTSADFGAHFFAGPPKGHVRTNVCGCLEGLSCDREHRLLSGTLFLGDTDGCRRLLDAWVDLNRTEKKGGGQRNLWRVWKKTEGLNTTNLPGRLCYVFDKPWSYPPDEPVIIEHTMASRENRPTDDMEEGFWRRKSVGRRKRVQQLRKLA